MTNDQAPMTKKWSLMQLCVHNAHVFLELRTINVSRVVSRVCVRFFVAAAMQIMHVMHFYNFRVVNFAGSSRSRTSLDAHRCSHIVAWGRFFRNAGREVLL